MNKIDQFWNEFITHTGRSKETKYVAVFHFELSERLANALLDLVLKGQKRATAASLDSFKLTGDPIPKKGDLNIITDWDGVPRCVVETKQVTILPFKDMTYDICKREGEDDDLESWKRGHQRFYTNEGKELGYTFTEDMLVVFEDFEVVYKK